MIEVEIHDNEMIAVGFSTIGKNGKDYSQTIVLRVHDGKFIIHKCLAENLVIEGRGPQYE